MKIRFLIFCLLLISATLSCSNSDNTKTSSEFYDSELSDILQNTFDSASVPGTALFIRFSDGSTWQKAVGSASIALDQLSAKPMDADLQFRIGSTTKTMIASSILILVDQGKLSLEDTVESILPNLITHGNDVTIEGLLSHNSRLVNYTNMEAFADIYLEKPIHLWTKNEIITLVKDEDLIETSSVNESFYSNSNYYLLGMIIEKLSEISLAEFMETNIFQPLKMCDSYLPVTNDMRGNFADGYLDLNLNGIFEPDEKISSQSPLAIWSAGAVISTLPDLAIWMEELMNGSLISETLQKRRMSFNWHVYGAPEKVLYGLGVMNQFGQIGHTGAVAGYTSIMFNYKGNNIIAFTNGFYLDPAEPNVPDLLLQSVIELVNAE